MAAKLLAIKKTIGFQGIILLSGFVILIFGLSSYFSPSASKSVASDLIERTQSIKDAQNNNSETYNYQSNFVPGIGRVAGNADLQNQLLQKP